jgi:pyruvate/2-oxoglutarate/acetoin dehydrogenase E1 component
MTYREAINAALAEELERDERVFLLGEDIGLFGGAMAVTKGLYERFGERRVQDMPISESVIVGGALGAALTGLRPVAELMFIDFVGVCMDQIANQVAKVRYMLGGQVEVPLVIRTQGGGGKSYAAQHSQSLEAWFMHTPGLKVVMPSNPADAKGLLKSAIRDNNPVLFIEHKLLYNDKGEVPEGEYLVPLGQAQVVREGTSLTIAAYSRMVPFAQQAAETLAAEGIDAEIVDLRTLTPLDEETMFASVRKTGRFLTVEEGHLTGGVGAELVARVARNCFDYLDAPPERVGAADHPIPCAPVLEKATLPQVEEIAAAARGLVQ